MTSTSPQQAFAFDASKYRKDFAAWLRANGHIVRRFFSEANAVWDRGRRHYSGRTLWEYIRHDTCLSEVDSEYVLNNNYCPDCVRLYQDTFPDRASLFSTRHMPGSARAA